MVRLTIRLIVIRFAASPALSTMMFAPAVVDTKRTDPALNVCVTGYLVGSLDRWNDAKQAEEKARVKHGVTVNKNGVYTTEQKAERELQKANQAKMMAKV